MQRHWVPDIASRFRDDEQNQGFPNEKRASIQPLRARASRAIDPRPVAVRFAAGACFVRFKAILILATCVMPMRHDSGVPSG
jgi:hypothetical protein